MNRTIVVVFAVFVLISGAIATAAAVADGDEVASGSEVYINAADSDNGDQYVRIDDNDEVRLQFDTLPPGSHTQVDDLFVIGFAGYEDSDDATEVGLESTDDRVTLERMDTGETFGNGTVELQPGESVLFGAVISTNAQGFSSTIELTVDVPDGDEDDGSGGVGGGIGGGVGGGGDAGTGDGDDGTEDGDDGAGDDDSVGDGDDSAGDDESGAEDEDIADDETDEGGAVDDVNGDEQEADDDTTESVTDTDSDAEIGLIELAGFGTPSSLVLLGGLSALLSLSYVYRLRIAAGVAASNAGGSGQ